MDRNIDNIGYAMYVCFKNKVKVTHSFDSIKKKYIIEVYSNNKLIRKFDNNPVTAKELNDSIIKTWIYYAKKL